VQFFRRLEDFALHTCVKCLHRSFDEDAEITLSSLDLEMAGDTLIFDNRGQADLGGAVGSLGRAVFSAGSRTYAVSFNSMGVARIDEA